MKNEKFSPELTPSKAASLLTSLPRIRTELKSQRIHPMYDYKGLDAAFLPNRDFPEPLYGGLDNFLGNAHCAGIRIIRPDESYEDAYADAQQKLLAITVADGRTLRENTRIAVLSIEDIRHWYSFENEVKMQQLDAQVGDRVWAESGLRRLDPERYDNQQILLNGILSQKETQDNLQGQGVQYREVGPTWPGVGVFYKNGNDEDISPVLVYNVKVGAMSQDANMSEVLVEQVLEAPVLVPAVVIRSIGESKREAYDRAVQVKQFITEKYGYPDIEIPVVSAGQIAAWNKMGFLEPAGTYIENDQLSWAKVVRYTHLGDDNMHPGPFTLAGISLFWSSHEYGVDGLFMERDGFSHKYMPRNGVRSLVVEGGTLVQKTLDNVGALLVIPEDVDVDSLKKQYIEPAQQQLKQIYGEKVNIALITPSFFKDVWVGEGPFDESNANDTTQRIVNFLIERKPRKAKTIRNDVKYGLHLPSLQPQIGAQRVMFNVDDAIIMHDFGKSFIDAPAVYRNAFSRPRTSSGMMIGFENGEYEMIPGIYAIPWLQQTADGLVGWIESPHPAPSFLRSEFFHRLTTDDIVNILGREKARKLMSVGKVDDEKFYGGHNYYLDLILASHHHSDHTGNIKFLAEPVLGTYMTDWTSVYLHWQMNKAGSSLEQLLMLANPNVKIGSAYEKMARQINLVDGDGEVVQCPGGYSFEMRTVDHSAEGSVSTMFTYPNGVNVLVTNDVKAGPNTDAMVNAFAGRADVIVFEATNLPEGDKASALATESDVYESFRYYFADANGSPIIMEIATDNMERLVSACAVATEFGYTVYADARTKSLISEINAARKEKGYFPGLDMAIPLPEQIGLYLPQMKNERPYARSLRVIAEQGGAGVIDPEALMTSGERSLVITSPFRTHAQDLKATSAPYGIMVIHSSPFPYEQDAKNKVRENYEYAVNYLGGKYIGDFFVTGGPQKASVRPNLNAEHPVHASGHMPFNAGGVVGSNDQPMIRSTKDLIKGLLTGRENKLTTLYSVHNESPGIVITEVKDGLRADKFNLKNLRFPQMKRNDPKVPWGWHIQDMDQLG